MTDVAPPRGFDLIRAAYDVPGLDQHERGVLVLLAFMANADGRAWPSIAHIVAKTGASKRTVQCALRRLEEAAHLGRTERLGRGVVYDIHPCQGDTGAGGAPVQETHRCGTDTGAGDARRGAPPAPKQPRTTSSQKASPSSKRAKAVTAFPDLPPWVPSAQWAAYAEMRGGMAKGARPRPWTPSVAAKAIEALKRLVQQGHDAAEVLDQSVLNGWQGLFSPKFQQRHHERPSGWNSIGLPTGMEPASLDDDVSPGRSFVARRRRSGNGMLDAIIEAEINDTSER